MGCGAGDLEIVHHDLGLKMIIFGADSSSALGLCVGILVFGTYRIHHSTQGRLDVYARHGSKSMRRVRGIDMY